MFIINVIQCSEKKSVTIRCNKFQSLKLIPHDHDPNKTYYNPCPGGAETKGFTVPYADIQIQKKGYNPYDLTPVLAMGNTNLFAILFKEDRRKGWMPFKAITTEDFKKLTPNNDTNTAVFTVDNIKKENFYITQAVKKDPTDFTFLGYEVNPAIALHNTSEWKKQALITLKANINTLKADIVANIISTIIVCNVFLQHTPLIFILFFTIAQLSFMRWHLSYSLLTKKNSL